MSKRRSQKDEDFQKAVEFFAQNIEYLKSLRKVLEGLQKQDPMTAQSRKEKVFKKAYHVLEEFASNNHRTFEVDKQIRDDMMQVSRLMQDQNRSVRLGSLPRKVNPRDYYIRYHKAIEGQMSALENQIAGFTKDVWDDLKKIHQDILTGQKKPFARDDLKTDIAGITKAAVQEIDAMLTTLSQLENLLDKFQGFEKDLVNQSTTSPDVLRAGDNIYIVVRVTNGVKFSEEIYRYGKAIDFTRYEKLSRRGLLALLTAGAATVFFKFGLKPIKQLGQSADYLMSTAVKLKDLSVGLTRRIMLRVKEDEKMKEQLKEFDAKATEKERQMVQRFESAFRQQQAILQQARDAANDYQNFTKSFTDFANKIGAGKVFETEPLSAYEKLAEKIWGVGREEINKEKYEKDFNLVIKKQDQLIKGIDMLEKEIAQALEEKDHEKAMQAMRDYLVVVGERRRFMQKVREQEIGNLENNITKEIDAELKERLGPDYIEKIEEFRKTRFNCEFWLPVIAGVAGGGLALAYIIYPVSKIGGKVMSIPLNAKARRKDRISRRDFLKKITGQR